MTNQITQRDAVEKFAAINGQILDANDIDYAVEQIGNPDTTLPITRTFSRPAGPTARIATMITLTSQMVRAAAQDAGDRSMRKAGRTSWNEDDWNAACATQRTSATGARGLWHGERPAATNATRRLWVWFNPKKTSRPCRFMLDLVGSSPYIQLVNRGKAPLT